MQSWVMSVVAVFVLFFQVCAYQIRCFIFVFSLTFSIERLEYLSCFSLFPRTFLLSLLYSPCLFVMILKSHPCIWHSSMQNQFNTTHKHKSTMNNFLSILKQNQQPPEEIIDEQKLCYIASQISIWDFFAISQANYLVSDKNAKSKMLGEYYIAFFW